MAFLDSTLGYAREAGRPASDELEEADRLFDVGHGRGASPALAGSALEHPTGLFAGLGT
jgi:hypothetical protein